MNKMPPNKFPVFDRTGVDSKTLKGFLIAMIRIREFEKLIAKHVEENKIITPCHLYIGQEAIATGVCKSLRKDDYVFGTHRSHGHYLAKGGSLKKAMAEIFGRSTGCSGGRGGSMHLCAPEVGILGTSSIVAGSVPIGIGAGLAESIKETDRISTIFHGDGVPEEGSWNESLNFAGINKLPVLFVCENNFYCTHLPIEARRIKNNIAELASAHGIPSVTIDGNNVLEVYRTSQQTVTKIRRGEGPQFIECKTYRWLGHVGPKDNLEVGLRCREELDAWKTRCPIKMYEEFLLGNKIISQEEKESIHSLIQCEIDDALHFSLSSPYPLKLDLLKHVHKER